MRQPGYDRPDWDLIHDKLSNIEGMNELLKLLLRALVNPGTLDRTINALRISPVSGTITTVSTVTNISYLNALGNSTYSLSPITLVPDQNREAWGVIVRGRIT